MNISVIESKKCSGCNGCGNICPKNAIVMLPDSEGFLKPYINNDLCIDCGLCYKLCTSKSNLLHTSEQMAYAIVIKDKNILKKSSSGGAFSLLAEYVLEKGGVVFGCEMNDCFEAIHCAVSNKKDLDKLRGSKYVQSNVEYIYRQVADYLKKDSYVLFSGTPCQVAALRAYLNKDYEKLITVDLICHGVSNNKFFKDYLEELRKKLGGEILEYKFRNKSIDGKFYGAEGLVKYKVGKSIKEKPMHWQTESYYYYYMGLATLRESCYQCEFAQTKRVSDFTIGDLWGANKMNLSIPSDKGISVLIVNTKKAHDILELVKDKIEYCELPLNEVSDNNSQLRHPSVRPELRDELFETWNNGGYAAIEKMFAPIKKNGKHIVMKSMIIRKTPVCIKHIIKWIAHK